MTSDQMVSITDLGAGRICHTSPVFRTSCSKEVFPPGIQKLSFALLFVACHNLIPRCSDQKVCCGQYANESFLIFRSPMKWLCILPIPGLALAGDEDFTKQWILDDHSQPNGLRSAWFSEVSRTSCVL